MEDEAVLSALYAYYGMPTDFPLRQQLLRRALEGRAKRLYFTSRPVLDLMLADGREQLKIVATGLKVGERGVVTLCGNGKGKRLAAKWECTRTGSGTVDEGKVFGEREGQQRFGALGVVRGKWLQCRLLTVVQG